MPHRRRQITPSLAALCVLGVPGANPAICAEPAAAPLAKVAAAAGVAHDMRMRRRRRGVGAVRVTRQEESQVRPYPKNSPEAMARIIALVLLADGDLDDTEVEMLDHLGIYERVGVSSDAFIRVVQEYFDDLLGDGAERIRLIDGKRTDAVLDAVDDPQKQRDLAGMIFDLVGTDGAVNDAELVTLRHLLARWGLSLGEVEAGLSRN